MSWKNIRLIFMREVRDQLRDRRTLFMITILPLLLYPMLGLGVVEMMLTFSQQRRTVVILNADQLPDQPALLDSDGISTDWYPDDESDAALLRVVTDLPGPPDADESNDSSGQSASGKQATRPKGSAEKNSEKNNGSLRPGERTDSQLLSSARQLRQLIQKHENLYGLEPIARRAANGSDGNNFSNTEDFIATGDSDDEIGDADKHLERLQSRSRINSLFMASDIQVLVIIPEGYRQSLETLQQSAANRNQQVVDSGGSRSVEVTVDGSVGDVPAIVAVRNGADDKSVMAYARIETAIENWEDAIREASFVAAALPADLQRPAKLELLELAQSEQVSASVWSKLFPALLVIMSLTGAFYAAIDLGAGEKERGTMETLLISPAKRVEVVLGKFFTIMVFSICTALLNLLSMGVTGQQMAALMGGGMASTVSLEFPEFTSLLWLFVLLIPLSALFSALCLALATFAKSTKEGQYYLTPLLMVVMGLTVFCLSPAIEMTPLYSVLPVINVALLLKGLLLGSAQAGNTIVYAIPVMVSSIGYSMLALWWAIELYNSEDVLFREAEKFDLRLWLQQLLRTKDAVPAVPEAVFCFIMILLLQFVAMSSMQPDLNSEEVASDLMSVMVVQQLVMIACPAVFMGVLLTTSLKATFRLRMPSLSSLGIAAGLALFAHPLSVELAQFLVSHEVFPPAPEGAQRIMGLIRTDEQPLWLLIAVFAVTPAICEELAFRGFILSGLARGGRLAIAVVVSSIMFGIVHMIPQQAFNAALLGLVLALLAVYSRSLFPAILFHMMNNTIATLHAGGMPWIKARGVFFSRDVDQSLRYESPVLILCVIAGSLIIIHMIQTVIRDQDLKRRGIVPSFSELASAAALEAGRPGHA